MGQTESTEISTPNKTRVVRVLSAHHATFQGRQSKDFPKGWLSKCIHITCVYIVILSCTFTKICNTTLSLYYMQLLVRDIPRSNQSCASHDTYWYSPECKFMFRSSEYWICTHTCNFMFLTKYIITLSF